MRPLARLSRYGPNELVERGGRSPWRILLEQLTGTLVLILIVAAVVSALVGDVKDAVAILAIVVLNAILGFVQEYRAEQAMAALKKLAVPLVRVRRAGQVAEVPAHDLVPGDIVLLEAGNLVPADGRLIEAANLRIQEAILTGESEAVEKAAAALTPTGGAAPALGDQVNMAFMGTTVTYGRGQMAVVATGMGTQLGHVAELIQGVETTQTPLQRRLNQLGRSLAIVAAALVVVIFVVGVALGEDWELMFMTAISMAVAVVPEGLPAVVTIALALGAQRMLKRQALIRKLPAVETLGSVTVICSDKTGTLTENRMTVTVLDLAGHRLDLTEEIRHREPAAGDGRPCERHRQVAAVAGAAPDGGRAVQRRDAPGRKGRIPDSIRAVGDPTEGALVVAAARFGLWKSTLETAYPRTDEAAVRLRAEAHDHGPSHRGLRRVDRRLCDHHEPLHRLHQGLRRWPDDHRQRGVVRRPAGAAGRRVAPTHRGRQRDARRQGDARAGRGVQTARRPRNRHARGSGRPRSEARENG